MAQADLTTVAAVESYLGLTAGNSDEPLLATLVTAASGVVALYCSQNFVSQSYSEVRDGKGTRRMPFRNTPAISVSSLTIDGNAIPAGDPVTTPGYFFDDTFLTLNGYRFCRGLGNVAFSYTAGYASVPPEVAQATVELVALRYREIAHLDMSSRAQGGETTAFIVADLKKSTKMVLDRYKRRAVM